MWAITIRQPWAWLIVHGPKRVENRSHRFPANYRGELLIHAAKGLTDAELEAADLFVRGFSPETANAVPSYDELPRGCIVGSCRLVDVIYPGGAARSGSPGGCHPRRGDDWYTGELGLVLDDVRPLEAVPCRGQLGMWRAPLDVLEQIRGRR